MGELERRFEETQRALEQHEQRYRTLAELLPDFAVFVDRERRYLWVNRVAPSLRMEDIIGKRVDDFVEPESRSVSAEAIERCFQSGEPTEYEACTRVVDGSLRWFQVRLTKIVLDAEHDCVLTLASDITERKRAELSLRRSEERLDRALRASGIGLWEWDPAADEIQQNGDKSSFEGWVDTVHRDDRALVRMSLEDVMEGRTEQFEVEYRVTTGGEERWVLHRGRSLARDTSGRSSRVVGTRMDVTSRHREADARRDLELRLQQAQRLESIGQLAGGMAHDFNNLLLVIHAHASLARESLRGTEREEDMAGILEAAERAAELTRKLLAFGRRQKLQTRALDLGNLLGPFLKMVRRLLPESIDIACDLADEPCIVEADPVQLEQVLLNLCLNARDAMHQGGRLRIEVRSVEQAHLRLQPHEGRAQRYVRMTVTDTGLGMTPEVLPRIFEPFFTTKPIGEGSGLGLAVTEGIVRQHDGFIRVESAPKRGTSVHIFLPRAASAPDEEPERGRAMVGGSETILVVEDDVAVRRIVVRILRAAGYEVIEACHGGEALEILEARSYDIDLILLDAVMPVMGGAETYHRIEQSGHRVRVIFTSGYSGDALPPHFLESRSIRLLAKPYRPETLLQNIREVLGESILPSASQSR